ncbi:MAG: cell division protein FtsZ [Alphaproteobacteria bacterium]
MIKISVPENITTQITPKITVIGVGGAGGNAVNNMIASKLEGVEFIVANTDAQALSLAKTDRRIQLGAQTTQGLGAGAKPEIGKEAAVEAIDEIIEEIQGSNMVFITAGMGGGTGTGAAPVIAKAAKEHNILTVGVITKPFQFEGIRRMALAEAGIEELAMHVDTLIVIPNQNLFRVANEKTTFADAFKMADDVLHAGIRSVTDLMIMPGLINLDFADVRTVMAEMGKAMMGTGEAEGEGRAIKAAEMAIANPLLDDTSMAGAKGVLINITGGMDLTLFEVDEAANRIRDEVDPDANIIFGSCFDENLQGKMRVSVVATGINTEKKSEDSSPYAFKVDGAARSASSSKASEKTDRPVGVNSINNIFAVKTMPQVTIAPEKPIENASNVLPVMPKASSAFAVIRNGGQENNISNHKDDNVFKPKILSVDEEKSIEPPASIAEPERHEPNLDISHSVETTNVQAKEKTASEVKPTQGEFFIPPAPEVPAHRSHLAYRENIEANKDDHTQESHKHEEHDDEKDRSRNIFERVTGLSIIRKARNEELAKQEAQLNHQHQEGSLTVSTEPKTTSSFNSDDLEIPSFLRRKST